MVLATPSQRGWGHLAKGTGWRRGDFRTGHSWRVMFQYGAGRDIFRRRMGYEKDREHFVDRGDVGGAGGDFAGGERGAR